MKKPNHLASVAGRNSSGNYSRSTPRDLAFSRAIGIYTSREATKSDSHGRKSVAHGDARGSVATRRQVSFRAERAILTPWRKPCGLAGRGRWLNLRNCRQPSARLCLTLPWEGFFCAVGVGATCVDTDAESSVRKPFPERLGYQSQGGLALVSGQSLASGLLHFGEFGSQIGQYRLIRCVTDQVGLFGRVLGQVE